MDFDEAEMDMIRRGDMLGPTLGAKVATALETLQRERDEAREALKPFAEAAGAYDPEENDSGHAAWAHDFTIGSLRRARSALSPKEAEE